MVEFEVKSKKQTIGKKKGQTVYYAVPKSNQHMTLDALCDMIMDETSLSRGDVMNTLITLGKMACRSLKMVLVLILATSVRSVFTSLQR